MVPSQPASRRLPIQPLAKRKFIIFNFWGSLEEAAPTDSTVSAGRCWRALRQRHSGCGWKSKLGCQAWHPQGLLRFSLAATQPAHACGEPGADLEASAAHHGRRRNLGYSGLLLQV